MSTVSGVFPNAITPTFAPSNDPAEQSRLRRQNETAVFSPVDELEQTSGSRRTAIAQPGRLEAEQSNEVASRLAPSRQPEQPEADPIDEIPRTEITAESSRPAENSADEDLRLERQQQQAEQRAAQEEAQLAKDIELIKELSARDREVRAHEQAHQSVGGQYAGAMEFTFQQGPDGKRYAVGGEVAIDVGKIPGDPQATLQKAEQVRRAALAPAEPSTQDRQVAALASQISIEAQSEIRQVERQEAEKAAEERAEQRELASESEEKTEASSESDEAKDERSAAESDERLEDILEKTSEAVESALDAAYRQQPQQEVGFNLDTTI